MTIEAPLGGAHAARVMVVDRVFDGASGTFGVRPELPNLEYLIPAGLRCRVRFLPGPWPEVASLLTDADLLLGEAGPPADNGRTVAAGARAGNAEEAAATAEAGERVRRAQELLRRTGFDPGPADGAWGPKTGEAVREFQTWYPRRGLEPTGRLNDVTYAALRSAAEIGLRRDQSDHHE